MSMSIFFRNFLFIFFSFLFQSSLLFIQLISWLLIPCTFILPLFAPKYIVGRLISWFSAISLPYSLLSVSYESFFLFIFFILLWIYIRIQFEFSNNNNYWTNMCFSTRKDFNNCGKFFLIIFVFFLLFQNFLFSCSLFFEKFL